MQCYKNNNKLVAKLVSFSFTVIIKRILKIKNLILLLVYNFFMVIPKIKIFSVMDHSTCFVFGIQLWKKYGTNDKIRFFNFLFIITVNENETNFAANLLLFMQHCVHF